MDGIKRLLEVDEREDWRKVEGLCFLNNSAESQDLSDGISTRPKTILVVSKKGIYRLSDTIQNQPVVNFGNLTRQTDSAVVGWFG